MFSRACSRQLSRRIHSRFVLCDVHDVFMRTLFTRFSRCFHARLCVTLFSHRFHACLFSRAFNDVFMSAFFHDGFHDMFMCALFHELVHCSFPVAWKDFVESAMPLCIAILIHPCGPALCAASSHSAHIFSQTHRTFQLKQLPRPKGQSERSSSCTSISHTSQSCQQNLRPLAGQVVACLVATSVTK